MHRLRNIAMWSGLGACALFFTGCDAAPDGAAAKAKSKDETKKVVAVKEHDHSGWWCTEHGVPEGECARCDSSLVAAFKKKGDWCKEHERPDSQCFVCHPELVATFATRYEAKYGTQPAKPTE